MDLTRKQVIEELKAILEMQYWNVPFSKAALEYAINSLKTDEAYQLMYEGGEIFTKDNMVDMLEELKTEIEDLYPEHQCTGELTGFADAIETITPIIQQKINALKGEQDENTN